MQPIPALSESDLLILEQHTEGWTAGLQLALLSLRGRTDVTSFIQSFGGNNKQVLDYLTSEVLEQQPPALQHFLLQTSILECMCAELCDALLTDESAVYPASGTGNAQATLEALERAKLIMQIQAQGMWLDYCRQLLAAFPTAALPALTPPSTTLQHAGLVEPISPRELEVLNLLALGKSNQEIADSLFISLGTVKSHTNSLFGKFGVASRTQAVARARELVLL